jgi:hypothetical protein
VSAKLSGIEVVEQLRRALRGEVAIALADNRGWNDTYAGDCAFHVSDWRIVFFNDCDELDYCDCATSPDGRTGDFDCWWDESTEPVALLTDSERCSLESMLESATAKTEREAG